MSYEGLDNEQLMNKRDILFHRAEEINYNIKLMQKKYLQCPTVELSREISDNICFQRSLENGYIKIDEEIYRRSK